jgi:hypothetical protein
MIHLNCLSAEFASWATTASKPSQDLVGFEMTLGVGQHAMDSRFLEYEVVDRGLAPTLLMNTSTTHPTSTNTFERGGTGRMFQNEIPQIASLASMNKSLQRLPLDVAQIY